MTGNHLRDRSSDGHGRVTYVELFFDLVFVFAVTQLSHSLLAHYTPLGAVETLLLMMAVWWVWIYTSWVTNWLDPERTAVRLVLFAIMLAGLVLSASIPRAFAEAGLYFALAHVAIQVGRSAFMIYGARGDEALTLNFQRILVWLVGSGVFWIAGGFAEGETRLILWLIALAIEYVSPSLGFWVPRLGASTTADWSVDGHHLSERCALFVIIALGESILVTGATFSGLAWEGPVLGAMLVSFLGSVAMWWIYFNVSADRGSAIIAHSHDPGRLARLAYTYMHLPIIAGIVVTAVGDEFVLAHPLGHGSFGVALAVVGGPLLYLVGTLMFKWALSGRVPRIHLAAIVALIVIMFFAEHLGPLSASALSSLVLILLAASERRMQT